LSKLLKFVKVYSKHKRVDYDDVLRLVGHVTASHVTGGNLYPVMAAKVQRRIDKEKISGEISDVEIFLKRKRAGKIYEIPLLQWGGITSIVEIPDVEPLIVGDNEVLPSIFMPELDMVEVEGRVEYEGFSDVATVLEVVVPLAAQSVVEFYDVQYTNWCGHWKGLDNVEFDLSTGMETDHTVHTIGLLEKDCVLGNLISMGSTSLPLRLWLPIADEVKAIYVAKLFCDMLLPLTHIRSDFSESYFISSCSCFTSPVLFCGEVYCRINQALLLNEEFFFVGNRIYLLNSVTLRDCFWTVSIPIDLCLTVLSYFYKNLPHLHVMEDGVFQIGKSTMFISPEYTYVHDESWLVEFLTSDSICDIFSWGIQHLVGGWLGSAEYMWFVFFQNMLRKLQFGFLSGTDLSGAMLEMIESSVVVRNFLKVSLDKRVVSYDFPLNVKSSVFERTGFHYYLSPTVGPPGLFRHFPQISFDRLNCVLDYAFSVDVKQQIGLDGLHPDYDVRVDKVLDSITHYPFLRGLRFRNNGSDYARLKFRDSVGLLRFLTPPDGGCEGLRVDRSLWYPVGSCDD